MTRFTALLLVLVFVVLPARTAAAGPIESARTDPEAPPTLAELRAAERMKHQTCGGLVTLVAPGVAQFCTDRPAEGAFLLSATAAEFGALGATFAVTDPPAPGQPPVPARTAVGIGLQNLWLYSLVRSSLDADLAAGKLYAPPDELPQMLAAPFDPRVLKRPAVLGGILVLAGGGTALQYALDRPMGFGGRPNLFGARPDERLGYPLAAGLHGVLMSHVATGEEVVFRGMIQSWAARSTTETGGWLIGSAIFGPIHATNAFFLEDDEVVPYLTIAVPWITLTGSWLGLVYRWGDYSLTGPIAVHWWYNMLVSATAFAADPENNLFSARIQLRW